MIQNLVNAATLGSIYTLFALGMSLVWGTIGILNFAHGSVFMFAAFCNFLILRELQLPIAVMLVVGVAVGAALSVAAYQFAFRPILRRSKDKSTAEMQMLICGIGLASIPVAVTQLETLSNPFGYGASSFQIHTYDLGLLQISNIQVIVIVGGAALAGAMVWWIKKSRDGLALRSIGVNSETASLMGINEPRLALTAMAIAGGLAGLAGTLLTFSFGAIPAESGDVLLLKAFAAIILGGVGSLFGTMAGAFFLAIAETVILTQTSGSWVDAVSFGLLFVVLLLRPQGFFGVREVRRA